MITDEHLPALQGMFPSWITTVSNDGEPNTTVISQIWHVNETEVALSFQFFNKTKKNRNKSQMLIWVTGCIPGAARGRHWRVPKVAGSRVALPF